MDRISFLLGRNYGKTAVDVREATQQEIDEAMRLPKVDRTLLRWRRYYFNEFHHEIILIDSRTDEEIGTW